MQKGDTNMAEPDSNQEIQLLTFSETKTETPDYMAIREFYAKHDIDYDAAMSSRSCQPYRFIRLNPRFDTEETLKMVKVSSETGCKSIARLWLV